MRETIELEVECHNGYLSQNEAFASIMPLTSISATPVTTTDAASTVQTTTTSITTQSIQQQQQPILQQPQLKHSAPKLTNLPTLSISGPHYETDEVL